MVPCHFNKCQELSWYCVICRCSQCFVLSHFGRSTEFWTWIRWFVAVANVHRSI